MALPKPISWRTFKERFQEKYFHRTAKFQLQQQFINLRQNTRSVDQYAAEFCRLSRFAPHMVASEEDRAKRFKQGLHLEIQQFVVGHDYATYDEVLKMGSKFKKSLIAESVRESLHSWCKRVKTRRSPLSRVGTATSVCSLDTTSIIDDETITVGTLSRSPSMDDFPEFCLDEQAIYNLSRLSYDETMTDRLASTE